MVFALAKVVEAFARDARFSEPSATIAKRHATSRVEADQ